MPEPVSLRHGRLSAAVDPMGAQLLSLQLDGCEYLWQGDPRFWARRAPVLFPIVGSLRDGRAESAQGPCVMGRHGIARNYEHAVVDRAADGSSVTFELRDSAETRAAYPYSFKLNMTYAITGEATLSQTFRVTNTGDATLPFCVGGHPAFNVPVGASPQDARAGEGGVSGEASVAAVEACGETSGETDAFVCEMRAEASVAANETCAESDAARMPLSAAANEAFEDYVLKFARPWSCTLPVIGEDGLMSWDNAFECPQGSDTVAFTHASFAHDALMFTDVPDSMLTLLGTKSGHGVRVEFPGFPYIGVWSAANDAPFVALEPWSGHTTANDEDDVFERKAGMTLLAPGETNERTFNITLF